jgi:hypothetical protein
VKCLERAGISKASLEPAEFGSSQPVEASDTV